jgi:hypothetical protein
MEDLDEDLGQDLPPWTSMAVLAGIVALCAWLALACTTGCSTLTRAPQVAEMSEPEFSRWVARLAAQAEVFASLAIEEGAVSPEAALRVAEVLDGLADGPPISGTLDALALDLPVWGAAALRLTLIELDDALELAGALEGPGWERGRAALRAVAEVVRRAALESEP